MKENLKTGYCGLKIFVFFFCSLSQLKTQNDNKPLPSSITQLFGNPNALDPLISKNHGYEPSFQPTLQ